MTKNTSTEATVGATITIPPAAEAEEATEVVAATGAVAAAQ